MLVSNHISYLDFIFAGLTALPAKRLVRFMAKKEVFDHRISGPLMRGMHHIPVDRAAGAAAFGAALKSLRDGEVVGVFAEATISRSFTIKEIKNGAVRMAVGAKVPMIPMALWGTQRLWTKGHPKRLFQRHVPITIQVGEPMYPKRGDDYDAVSADLRERMATMLDQAQRSYPEIPRAPGGSPATSAAPPPRRRRPPRWTKPRRRTGRPVSRKHRTRVGGAGADTRGRRRTPEQGEDPCTEPRWLSCHGRDERHTAQGAPRGRTSSR
ncbi:lysophospholipid acyltransferase family protein [Streptosporangium lutulentum]